MADLADERLRAERLRVVRDDALMQRWAGWLVGWSVLLLLQAPCLLLGQLFFFERDDALMQRWAGWLVGWLVGWLAGWLVGQLCCCFCMLHAMRLDIAAFRWLVGWLVGWLNSIVAASRFLPACLLLPAMHSPHRDEAMLELENAFADVEAMQV